MAATSDDELTPTSVKVSPFVPWISVLPADMVAPLMSAAMLANSALARDMTSPLAAAGLKLVYVGAESGDVDEAGAPEDEY